MADPVAVIQATLAPVFLISGAAIFLTFVQARLFRVVDRLRTTNTGLRHAPDVDEVTRLLRQQKRGLRRALILRNATLFGVLVIAFTVATTLLLLFPSLFPSATFLFLPLITFAAALVCFSVALVYAVTDAFVSVASMREAAEEYAEAHEKPWTE